MVSITRYGNVMYSRGSVIPLFVEQVRSGRPLTVTDPDMTRFLMSLGESVELVQYAFANAQPGDLFVRKAPASTVADLARAVALVLGVAEPEVQVIGTRHGEKLYESLLSREEMAEAEDCGDYYRVPLDGRSLNYGMYFEEGSEGVSDFRRLHSHNTERLDVEGVVELLERLPEFQAIRKGMQRVRVLVLGASGMLGHKVLESCLSPHEAWGSIRPNAGEVLI